MDWRQLWDIVSAPDNVPIVALIPLLIFYIYLAWKQAKANDDLIGELETSPAMAKIHHRKTWPFRPGWQKEVHVWPFRLRIEFLAAIIVTAILFVWSITLNAPLEEPANPNLTMNPSKAPWYFLGLQEMLVYFDPWIAGVVMPSIIMIGLMVFPYVDSNPLGNGYYTLRQRRFAVNMFSWGFLMWILLIIIGTFIRGPGWIWFWPGETWDHNTVVFDRNRDLHEILGVTPENFANHLTLLPSAYLRGATSDEALGQYHLRERVDQTLTERVEYWAHPLTQVVLTSLRKQSDKLKFVAHTKYHKQWQTLKNRSSPW